MQMSSLININVGGMVISSLKLFALWSYTVYIIVVRIHHYKGFLITADVHAINVRA